MWPFYRYPANSYIRMAGGETSGTAMASVVYFLLKNPEAHRKLNAEVRTAYDSYTDIDLASTTKLGYLMAMLKEGMRISPTATSHSTHISRYKGRGVLYTKRDMLDVA